MVNIKVDEGKLILYNKRRIDELLIEYGYKIDKGLCGSTIFNGNSEIGRYTYMWTCDIYGPSTLFVPVAEAIEEELGIEVIIYE